MAAEHTHDSEASEPYQYSPLDEEAQEVRLLTLLPGPFSAEIRVCLDITPFTEDRVPKFEAVSYTWGSTENPVGIFIGESGQRTLAVTQNLAEALPYFRYEDKPRVLWIDAICVDQQNLKERGHQIKRMADVFSKATKVLVWLGPESENSALAINRLEYIATKVEIDWSTFQVLPLTDEAHWADITVVTTLTEDDLVALSNLVGRPWFSRLWIRQEVQLATGDIEVMCGDHKILWSTVRTAVYFLFAKNRPWFAQGQEFLTRMEAAFNLCGIGEKGLRIDTLINKSKDSVCSDPRDKIYALLSLLRRAECIAIEPDYTKSVYEVYQHATLSLIKFSRKLAVLNTVEEHEELEGIPSWVPNWIIARPCIPLPAFSASSNTDHSLPIGDGQRILKVDGVTIALIQEVEPLLAFYPTYANKERISELKAIAIRTGFQADSFKSDQHRAFTRAVCVNCFSERTLPPQSFLRSAQQSAEAVYGMITSETNNHPVITHIQHICRGRSFYVTKDGIPGLGPLATKQGDIVTILLGSDSPMILRPTADGNYKVIGETYCDGFMDGEALLGPFPDSVEAVHRLIPNNNMWLWAYLNRKTGGFQQEDPRLGPLPNGWRWKVREDEGFWKLFVNDETGEETEDDPRLTSEALRKRGVPLQVFELI